MVRKNRIGPERVAIIGSRPEHDIHAPREERQHAKERDLRREQAIDEYVASLPEGTIIVSGGAPGADTWAEEAAHRHCLPSIIC